MVRYIKAGAWAFGAAIGTVVVWPVLSLLWGAAEIQSTGSGGLGAVSAGVSEAILIAAPIIFVLVFVWRLRRTRKPAAPLTATMR